MIKFFFKRLLEIVPVLWVIATLTFFMVRLAPGGPFDEEKNYTHSVQAQVCTYYGLDQPLYLQYGIFLKKIIQGDLGPSLKYPGYSVNELIKDRLFVSLELGGWAFLLAIVLGIAMGIGGGIYTDSFGDYITTGFCILGICLPSFVLGPILIYVCAIKLQLLNATGWACWQDRILPTITLSFFYAAYIGRLTRSSMIEVKYQPYIRTAFAKGLSVWRVYAVHALKNALCPVIVYTGPTLAALVSGSFVVETLFHIPGLGQFFVIGTFNRDYTLIMGVVLLYGFLLTLLNTLSDIVLAWVNPKIRFIKNV